MKEKRDSVIVIRTTKTFKEKVVALAEEKGVTVSTVGKIALDMLMKEEVKR